MVKTTTFAGIAGFSFPSGRHSKFAAILFVLMICAGFLHAQDLQSQVPQKNGENIIVNSAPIRTEDYVIGPDDMLNVYILDVPELSRDYRVSASGAITLPVMANPINAAGLTLAQFSEQLSKELKEQGLVSDPHITMSVNQSNMHSISITGAVRQPQVYPVLTRTTLLDVISQAQGLTDDAGGTAIVHRGEIGIRAVKRNDKAADPAQTQNETFTVDLRRLLESSDSHVNVNIYPGDRITVVRAGVVYVVGAVNKPGGFTMKSSSRGMTVLQAIALAEDTKSTAKRSETVIIRNDPQAPDGRRQIPLDLKAILQGKKSDTVLQAEDIVFVPDSTGKRALHRGLESILQVASGAAIYSSHF